ncbi:MAG: CheW protein [Rhodoferax sp.]|nr:CheW protein [Rhodoferax sp.]
MLSSHLSSNSKQVSEDLLPRQDRRFLTFRLGGEEYGIGILQVQEIRGYVAPTRIANAPSFLKGVLNLRGVIVPIIDLRLKFGLRDVRYDGTTVSVVLIIGQRVMAIVVDAVSDVMELGAEQIQPAPNFDGAAGTEHIIGLSTPGPADRQRMVILLDIEGLMNAPDMGLTNATSTPSAQTLSENLHELH